MVLADGRLHLVPGDGRTAVTVSVTFLWVKQCPSSLKSFEKERQRVLFLQTTHLRTCVSTTTFAVADSQHVAAVDGLQWVIQAIINWRLSLDVVAGPRAHPCRLGAQDQGGRAVPTCGSRLRRQMPHKCGSAMRYPRFCPIHRYHIRQIWTKGYIDFVIALQTELGELGKLPKLRANFVSLVDVGLKATLSLERRKAAWARLSCDNSNLLQVLDEADELHTAGFLFPSNAETEGGCQLKRLKIKWRMCGKVTNQQRKRSMFRPAQQQMSKQRALAL
eukprot:2563769-Amphidinium_carterae.1